MKWVQIKKGYPERRPTFLCWLLHSFLYWVDLSFYEDIWCQKCRVWWKRKTKKCKHMIEGVKYTVACPYCEEKQNES